MHTPELQRLRRELREGDLAPIVRTSRSTKLEINADDITFVCRISGRAASV